MAREFVMVCEETSLGVTKTTPVLGTNKFYMRLHQQAAFEPKATPVHQPILGGGGVATQVEAVSDVVQTTARFSFLLFPGIYSAYLLNWAITPINGARAVPWTTTAGSPVTLPVGDLASLSFYRAYLTEDGTTIRRERWAGMKCLTWEINGSQEANGRILTLSGTAVGKRVVGNPWDSSSDPDATEFPAPTEAQYPSAPYTFGHLATGSGGVTVGTNRASSCMNFKLSGTNKITPEYYTGRFPAILRYTGRDVKLDATLRFLTTPDDRDAYRQLIKKTVSLVIDNATNSLTFAMNAANLVQNWAPALPMDREYQQTLGITNQMDATASGADISVTAA